tara:strand:+ start:36 stop:248 length:213 start_codon:yes stop_codon:yes gene_type:complete
MVGKKSSCNQLLNNLFYATECPARRSRNQSPTPDEMNRQGAKGNKKIFQKNNFETTKTQRDSEILKINKK